MKTENKDEIEFPKTDQMLLTATFSPVEELMNKGRAKVYSDIDGNVVIVLFDTKYSDDVGFVDSLSEKSEDIKTDESNFPKH